MKNLLLVLTAIIFISCSKKAEIKPVATAPVKEPDCISTIIGNIYKEDDSCLDDIESAKKDLQNDSIAHTYYLYPDNVTIYGYALEMQVLLKPYGLKCDKGYNREGCIPVLNHRYNCYFDYLKATLDKKFRPGLLDSLKVVAIRNYIMKNPDEIFQYYAYADKTMIYSEGKSYESQFDDFHKDFMAQFKYPKGFVFNKDGKPNWTTDGGGVIIYKNGRTKSFYSGIDFANRLNAKHEKYFVKCLNRFVNSVKWNVITAEGLPVNCRESIWFNDTGIVSSYRAYGRGLNQPIASLPLKHSLTYTTQ